MILYGKLSIKAKSCKKKFVYHFNTPEYRIIHVVSNCKWCTFWNAQRIERKEEVILLFRKRTLRRRVFCWMHSVCLCWHKLSAGWLATGRLPAVTSTIRVRWLYCKGATLLRIPPHIPKPTLRWRIDARGGLLLALISAASLPLSLLFWNFSSSHPICFVFRDSFYICSRSLC